MNLKHLAAHWPIPDLRRAGSNRCRIAPGGFTLVEAMVVIAVLALITSMAVPSFGTFAGRVQVDSKIVWMKLQSLAEGARRASAQLWAKAA